MRLRFPFVLLVLLSLNACGGYSPYYTSDPIEAWVVDAETGLPIEGAVVTANWQLVAFGFDTGGRKLRQLAVMETVTDKNGRFAFPGFTKLNPSFDELRDHDPQILVFKPGYEFGALHSEYPMRGPAPGAHRHSEAIGQTLRLNKANSNLEAYAWNISSLGTQLEPIENSRDIESIPRMVSLLNCERDKIKKINSRLIISVPSRSSNDVSCNY